ncbi:Cytochrome c oxidase subunit 6b-3 [Picochlorum sp. SENEW3]|nr:Cytochrome c oxidase subunit 6b-3 [Picochlorum sp. SENEW3]
MGNTISVCEEAVAPVQVADPEDTVETPEPVSEDIQPEVEEKKQITVDTARIDPRFPATNQARHCFVKYNEAHKCWADRGEDDDVCKRLARDYRAICPAEWLEKWNEARENGTWWGKW